MFSKLLTKSSVPILNTTKNNALKTVLRNGGGGPRMMRYRDFVPTNFKMAVRYILYGAVPSSVFCLYMNLFVGDAVLHDYDPEQYQPECHEFFQNPVTRWMAKYIKEDPAISYYRRVNRLEKEIQVRQQQTIIKTSKNLQAIEGRGLYFSNNDPLLGSVTEQKMVDEYAREHNLIPGQEFQQVRGNPDAPEIDVTTMNFRDKAPSEVSAEQ